MNPFRAAGRRGNELEDSGDFEGALKSYAEMMGGDKRDQLFSYIQQALLLEKLGRLEEAIELYRLARKHSPDFEQPAGVLYNCLIQCGRFDEAVEEARNFFDGRLEHPHPDPLFEDFRQIIVNLFNLDDVAYSRAREECIEHGMKRKRAKS